MRSPCPARLAALALAAACHAAARAETSPYALGIEQSLARETNLLHAPEGAAIADSISTTTLLAALDQPIGRQRLRADARLGHAIFRDNGQFDHNPHRVDLQLDWATLLRWQGELGVSSGEQLYRYDLGAEPAGAPNFERSTRAFFNARAGVVTRWSVEAAALAEERRYSLAGAQRYDQRQASGEAALRYQPSPGLGLRIALRYTGGEYPQYAADGADEFHRTDIEASIAWQPSGASTLDLRLAGGREEHSRIDARSAKVWAGSLRWRWQPTGKLALTTTIARDSDTGTGAGDTPGSDPGPPAAVGSIPATADAQVATSAEISASYAASAKVQLQTGLQHVRRRLDSSFVSASGTASEQGSDRTTAVRLGLSYQPARALEFGCSLQYEKRTVADGTSGLSFPYRSRSAACFGQLWWR